jgi:hypothetical protein
MVSKTENEYMKVMFLHQAKESFLIVAGEAQMWSIPSAFQRHTG